MISKPSKRATAAVLAVASASFALAFTTTAASGAVGPNGQIAYVASGPRNDPFGPPTQDDIWVMSPDGTGQTNLTDSASVDDNEPAWSPDGARIAYISGATRDLTVMNADGSSPTTIVSGALTPSWSPDGTRIAVLKERAGSTAALVIVDLATGAQSVVSERVEMEPAWSPDGSRFAFVGLRNETWTDPSTGLPDEAVQHEIVVVNADGSGEVIVSAGDPGSIRATSLEEDRAPSWSPDGSKLVFMSQSQFGGCCGPWQLWAVNADGSGITNLATDETSYDMFPSWSPDGSAIVFSRSGQTGPDLYTMPAPSTLPPSQSLARITTVVGPTDSATALTSNGNAADPSWGTRTATRTFRLTVATAGRGTVTSTPAGIRCGTDCSESFPARTKVTLRAKPAPGFRFVRWAGPCTGTTTTCVVNVTRNRNVTAVFARS